MTIPYFEDIWNRKLTDKIKGPEDIKRIYDKKGREDEKEIGLIPKTIWSNYTSIIKDNQGEVMAQLFEGYVDRRFSSDGRYFPIVTHEDLKKFQRKYPKEYKQFYTEYINRYADKFPLLIEQMNDFFNRGSVA